MLMLTKVRPQAGDTIVEVLICIAVISTVLTGAFIVVSKSNRAIQNSAEHAQAQQRLQGEVESLRAYLATVTTTSGLPGNFCFKGSPVPVAITTTPPNCEVSNGGGATYSLSITPVTGKSDTYECSVSWDAIDGKKVSETYYYQVYPNKS